MLFENTAEIYVTTCFLRQGFYKPRNLNNFPRSNDLWRKKLHSVVIYEKTPCDL